MKCAAEEPRRAYYHLTWGVMRCKIIKEDNMRSAGKKAKNGKWIKREHLFRKTEYVCSVCRRAFDSPTAFCPACGSRNRGQKADPAWIEEMEFYDA